MSDFLPDDLVGAVELERDDMPLADVPIDDPGRRRTRVVETEWTATEFFVEWIEPIEGAAGSVPLPDPFQPPAAVGVGAAVAGWIARRRARRGDAREAIVPPGARKPEDGAKQGG